MDAFRFQKPKQAEQALRQVLGWMARSQLPAITQVAKTIKRHFDGVMNAIISGITNATSEAINSRIQVLKRRAAGYRNRSRFRDAIYFHLGGLDLSPNSAASNPNP